MLPLTEDKAKVWLRRQGFPVPDGVVVVTPGAAAEAAARFGGSAVVKALVPTGRRGISGGVRVVNSSEAAAEAARSLLGTDVQGHRVDEIYVETRVEISAEYYLSINLESFPPRLLLSRHGGIDIEQTQASNPDAITVIDLDPTEGLNPWDAVSAWKSAGVNGEILPRLGAVTASLFTAFQTADALMLEINPLCVQTDGKLSLVGAMVGIDDDALGRQASWLADEAKPEWMFAGRNLNERERAVFAANQRYRGGMIRYSELDGDIGLIFNGGGAGLLQHDLILAMGGRPANHSDMNGINQDKIKALAHAVLDNPNIRGLLISANHLQMTRADRKVEPIMQVLAERSIDYAKFPVVIRMFGPREAEAREAAAMVPGVHYLPSGTPLEDACRLIVDLTRTGVTQ